MRSKRPTRLPSDLRRPKVLRAFYRLGFVLDHEGSKHTVLKDPTDPTRFVSLPRHSRVKVQLLRGILRGVGLSEDQFMAEY